MQVLMTGGSGFIGGALSQRLAGQGHDITVLTRQSLADSGAVHFVRSLDDLADDDHFDVVINLAGASMAGKRWTSTYKQTLLGSRLHTTRALVDLLDRLAHKPEVLLSASAIGYYGHHYGEELPENGPVNAGFSSNLCQQWEEEALRAKALGIRVCLLRLGVVLDSGGGAFEQMVTPFRFGVANWLGNGRQWLSWIHRKDVVEAILFLLDNKELAGPFNLTAPGAVDSRGFCDAMRRHTRTLLAAPVPGFVMRMAVGEMADELLLNGQRVVPAALEQAGFEFRYPDLDSALENILGR